MDRPKVGVAVFIRKEGKVLVGKRIGGHGAGCWGLPGGHLEYGETPEECACREVAEEVGIKISNMRLGPYTNDLPAVNFDKHYITLYVFAEYNEGEVRVLEPDKCEEWKWIHIEELKATVDLFHPLQNLILVHGELIEM
jgi:8-oxo-dGTP diphosphatase